MRLFPAPVDPSNGFGSDDLFDRKPLADRLTRLLTKIEHQLVLVVDGQWGSGKTTFLKMWQAELSKGDSPFPVIYFDAFENDYMADAFIAIAREIIGKFNDARSQADGGVTDFQDKAKKIGKVLLRSALKISVKAATLGTLDNTDIDGLSEAVAEGVSEAEDKIIGDLLSQNEAEKQLFTSFRNTLEALPRLNTAQQNNLNPRPLIFIIDELDRCRPDFALEILERIKHFFNVPNVHFVMGAHMEQLQNSIRSVYGPEINANIYLQKFFHVTVHLVDISREKSQSSTAKYVEHLRKNLIQIKSHHILDITNFISVYSMRKGVSLRSIERIISLIILSCSNNQNGFSPIIAGLCVLKIMHPTFFLKSKSGILKYDDIANLLAFNENYEDDRDKKTIKYMRYWWEYCLKEDASEEIMSELSRVLDPDWRLLVVQNTANEIVDGFSLLN